MGDVITFQPVADDPALTTHRIEAISVGSEGRQFVTRGDANNVADLSPVEPGQVVGEVWYSVPLVGYVSVWVAGDWVRLADRRRRGRAAALRRLVPRRPGWSSAGAARRCRHEPAPRDASCWPAALVVALLGVLGLSAPAYAEQKKLKLATTATGPFGDHLTHAAVLGAGPTCRGSAHQLLLREEQLGADRPSHDLAGREGAGQRLRAGPQLLGVASTAPPARRCRSSRTGRRTSAARSSPVPRWPRGAVQRIDVSMHVAGQRPDEPAGHRSRSWSR